jgi:hypothetical protein
MRGLGSGKAARSFIDRTQVKPLLFRRATHLTQVSSTQRTKFDSDRPLPVTP